MPVDQLVGQMVPLSAIGSLVGQSVCKQFFVYTIYLFIFTDCNVLSIIIKGLVN